MLTLLINIAFPLLSITSNLGRKVRIWVAIPGYLNFQKKRFPQFLLKFFLYTIKADNKYPSKEGAQDLKLNIYHATLYCMQKKQNTNRENKIFIWQFYSIPNYPKMAAKFKLLGYLEGPKIFKINVLQFVQILVSYMMYVQLQISCNIPLRQTDILPDTVSLEAFTP